MAEIIEAGGQRISVGGRLAWVAVNSMAAVAVQLRDGGEMSSLADPAQIIGWLAD